MTHETLESLDLSIFFCSCQRKKLFVVVFGWGGVMASDNFATALCFGYRNTEPTIIYMLQFN